jgi:diacylglycerol kinase (ATP)
VVVLLVLLGKALTHSPGSLAGGMPSGHAAVAFGGWIAASFVAADGRYGGLVSAITLLMALLVSQSRVESGTHTLSQVAMGAVVGVLVTVAAFQLL